MSDKKLSKEEIEDIEYLQKNLFKSLKIPLNLHGLKEDDGVGVKSLEITKMSKEETKFKVGDKAHKPKGYKFPCTIVGVFETINGDVRIVGEMDEYGLLHIFNEDQLEHYGEQIIE